MGKLMTRQVTQLSEGAAALLAEVRLVPSVNALVSNQGTGASECPATLIAHVLGLALWTTSMVMRGLILIVCSPCVREMPSLERSSCFLLMTKLAFLNFQNS